MRLAEQAAQRAAPITTTVDAPLAGLHRRSSFACASELAAGIALIKQHHDVARLTDSEGALESQLG